MNSPAIITEVVGRAEQGMTRPFICKAQFNTWYVKGAYAGLRSLCCEWVAGRLAKVLKSDVPIGVPLFMMAEMPKVLIEESQRKDIRDLGSGLVFASMKVDDGQEMTWSAAQGWSTETMATLLLIDLWLRNEDRTLSALGGNPNLLVQPIPELPELDPEGALWKDQPRRELLWAYDFNLAFDEQFDRRRFFQSHVFGGMLKQWPEGFRESAEPKLAEALALLPEIFSELPKEWLYVDGDDTLPVQLSQERVYWGLNQPFADPETFWKMP